MNPAYPPAQEYLLNIVREIVSRYAVDGIHLDYIRYEDNGADDFGYHPWSIEQFRKEYGVEPRKVARHSPLRQKWVKWRQDQVTGFVRKVRQLVDDIRPGLLISAAVFAEPAKEAKEFRFQDWPAEADAAAVRGGQKTYWYQGIGQYGLSDDETARRIQLNRELGADGSVLFSLLYMKLEKRDARGQRRPRWQASSTGWRSDLPPYAVYPAEASRPEDGRPAATLWPLVNRLREVAHAARAAAPLTMLQAQVADLQAVVQGTSPASDLSRALDALVPLTVEALQTELT